MAGKVEPYLLDTSAIKQAKLVRAYEHMKKLVISGATELRSSAMIEKTAMAQVNMYPAIGSLFGPNVWASQAVPGKILSAATAWRILGAPTKLAIPEEIVLAKIPA